MVFSGFEAFWINSFAIRKKKNLKGLTLILIGGLLPKYSFFKSEIVGYVSCRIDCRRDNVEQIIEMFDTFGNWHPLSHITINHFWTVLHYQKDKYVLNVVPITWSARYSIKNSIHWVCYMVYICICMYMSIEHIFSDLFSSQNWLTEYLMKRFRILLITTRLTTLTKLTMSILWQFSIFSGIILNTSYGSILFFPFFFRLR